MRKKLNFMHFLIIFVLFSVSSYFVTAQERAYDERLDLVPTSFARNIADYQCSTFFGEKDFFDVEVYYDENDKAAVYVHIYREPGVGISKKDLDLIIDKANEKNDIARQMIKEGLEQKDLDKEAAGKKLRWEALKELNQRENFYSIYVSASKTHMPVIEWRKGLPQSYTVRGDILKKLSGIYRKQPGMVRFYYFSPVDVFARGEIQADDKKVLAIRDEITELPESVLRHNRFRRELDAPGKLPSSQSIQSFSDRQTKITKAWSFFEEKKHLLPPAGMTVSKAQSAANLDDVPNFLQHDFSHVITGSLGCIVMATADLIGYYDHPQHGNYWNLVDLTFYDGTIYSQPFGGFNVHNDYDGDIHLDHTRKISIDDFVRGVAEALDYNFQTGGTDTRNVHLKMSTFTNSGYFGNNLSFNFNELTKDDAPTVSDLYNNIKAQIDMQRPTILWTYQYSWDSGYVSPPGQFYPEMGNHAVVVKGYSDDYWSDHPEQINHPICVYPNGIANQYDEIWWDLADMERNKVSLITAEPGGDTGGTGSYSGEIRMKGVPRTEYERSNYSEGVYIDEFLDWDDAPGAIGYAVQVSSQINFPIEQTCYFSGLKKSEIEIVRIESALNCQHNQIYYRRVKYMNQRQNWSSYSSIQPFIFRSYGRISLDYNFNYENGELYIGFIVPSNRTFSYTISHNADWLQIAGSGVANSGENAINFQRSLEENNLAFEKENLTITICDDDSYWEQPVDVNLPIYRFNGLYKPVPFVYITGGPYDCKVYDVQNSVVGKEGIIFNNSPSNWAQYGYCYIYHNTNEYIPDPIYKTKNYSLSSNMVNVKDFHHGDPSYPIYYRILGTKPWIKSSLNEGILKLEREEKEFEDNTSESFWGGGKCWNLTFDETGMEDGTYNTEISVELSDKPDFSSLIIDPPQKLSAILVVGPESYGQTIDSKLLRVTPPSIVRTFTSKNDPLNGNIVISVIDYSSSSEGNTASISVVTDGNMPQFINPSDSTVNFGVLSGPIYISVNNSNLRAGDNIAWIEVSVPGAINSPQRIPVSIFVEGPPTIEFVKPDQDGKIYPVEGLVPFEVKVNDDNGISKIEVSVDNKPPTPFTFSNNPIEQRIEKTFSARKLGVGNHQIQVTAYDITNNSSQEEINFEVVGLYSDNIKITAPASGENWAIGSTQTITWEEVASADSATAEIQSLSGNVSINLYKDDELLGTIFSDIANTGQTMWTISTFEDGTPIDTGSNYQLGIESTDGTFGGFMEGTFTIRAADALEYLTLSSPNGGEEWSIGEIRDIKWNSAGYTGNIKIQLEKINGTFAGEIVENIPVADGNYSWLVGQTTDGQLTITDDFFRVKILTTDNQTLDESDNYFRIFDNSNYSIFNKVTSGPIVNDRVVEYSQSLFVDATWADYDKDGYLDLFVACRYDNNRLYKNNGNGTFTQISDGDIVNKINGSYISKWGDFITDGYPDLITFDLMESNSLYRNNGDNTFFSSGTIQMEGFEVDISSIMWIDYNNNGALDLFVTTHEFQDHLYKNNGNGNFEETGDFTTGSDYSYSFCLLVHMNDDVFPDIVVNNYDDFSKAIVYKNTNNGSFLKVSDTDLLGTDFAHYTISGWGDFDNDGDADIIAIGETDEYEYEVFLCINDGNGTFTKKADCGITWDELDYPDIPIKSGDFDNDGYLDLLVGMGNLGNYIYRNNGDGTFSRILDGVVAIDPTPSRQIIWVDYNNDGFLDILSLNGYRNSLYKNIGNNNNWIEVICNGTLSNPTGHGAKVRINTEINSQVSNQLQWISEENNFRAHFGLGNANRIDEIRVEWPSGTVQSIYDVPVNQILTITESASVLRITSPNGGENLQGGTTHNITWLENGVSGDVRIEYSTDEGITYTEVVASTENDGLYEWIVPGVPSEYCMIRISEVSGALQDESDGVFVITGTIPSVSLTIDFPNGGESFEVGTTQTISWTSEGSLETLKMEYSIDNGNTWLDIASSISDTGSFEWTVPDTASDQCLIRVSDIDGDPVDVSDAVFSITAPSAICGTTWETLDMSVYGITNVIYDVEYGNSQFVMVGSAGFVFTSGDGFNWTRQSSGSNKHLKGIIYDGSNYLAVGTSGTLLASSDGINWTTRNVGTTYSFSDIIYANSTYIIGGDNGYVYTSSDGLSWTQRNTSAGANLTGLVYGNNLFVGVARYGRIVTSPDGVTWTSRDPGIGSINLNKVAYGNSRYVIVGDGGTILGSADGITWSEHVSGTSERLHSVSFGSGQFAAVGDSGVVLTSLNGIDWTVQSSGTTGQLLGVSYVDSRFMAVGGLATVIYSDCGIPVTAADITVTAPNGGESWEWNTQQVINWETSNGVVGNVKIDYSTDSGSSWAEIAASIPNLGSFDWTVPDTFSDSCLVRVSDIDGNPVDESDAVFSIVTSGVAPTLTVSYPNGGETFYVGTPQTLSWSSEGYIENLKLEYSIDNGNTWLEIAGSISDTGSFEWTVPDTASDQCLIRVSDIDGDPVDVSDAVFSIAALSATCGTTWETLDMSVYGITNVIYDVEYGSSQFVMVGSGGIVLTSGDGFNWTQQSSGSNKHLKRVIYDGGNYLAVGTSGTLLASSDGINWTTRNVGTTYSFSDIVYANSTYIIGGDNGYVYTSSDGLSWTQRNSTAGANLTGLVYGNNLFVGVAQYGRIVTSPDGVTWTSRDPGIGSINLNKVAYGNSRYVVVGDGGTILGSADGITWSEHVSGTSERLHSVSFGSGQFAAVGDSGVVLTSMNGIDWTVQSSGTTGQLLGVSYVDSRFMAVGGTATVIYSDCGIPVTAADITVTAPNGGESWEWNTQQVVNWETSNGVVGNVKIDYSTDSGSSWFEIAASIPNLGSYDWTVPDTFSDSCLVRVSDIDGAPVDESDAVFSIVSPGVAPTLSVSSPNGGETFYVGTTQTISWSSEGYIENLKLEYSIDNGNTWLEIANSISDTGSFEWTIPGTASDQCLIRVSDIDGDPVDVSDAVFSIAALSATCGITWETLDMSVYGITNVIYDVEYGNSQFVMVGSGGIVLTSGDGFNWTQQSSGSNKHLKRVLYDGSNYLAVGTSGTLLASSDGINWTTRNVGTTYSFSDIIYANSTYIIASDNSYVYTSSDGLSWTQRNTSAGANHTGLVYGNSLFVGIAQYGRIVTSPDGITWTKRDPGIGSVNLNKVAYGNSRYVIVGDGGTILGSVDGITWSEHVSGTSERLHSVTFDSGQFVAVGDSGVVLTSLNGIDWTVQSSGTTGQLLGVSYVDSRFMAVGGSATVIYSDCSSNQ